jgi:short-subunit dehydrogenase
MTRFTRINASQFGPWALVTGASSGIGREFARQLAANGINLVLAARRADLLDQVGKDLTDRYDIRCRPVPIDLAVGDAPAALADATTDLDIGLVVSNAGDMLLGEFLTHDHDALLREMQLNATTHLSLTRHFAPRLTQRERGGILLVSSIAGIQGVPYTANYSATKAYLLTLGEALHHELSPHGVHVTVLIPGATKTPMTARFDVDKTPMGRLLMHPDACAREGLTALRANRATRISGRMNRTTIRLTPRATRTRMFGAMNKSMAERTEQHIAPA